MTPILRKQVPPLFKNYREYKPFLRLDFERRCAYCYIPESRYGTPGNYTIDHFRPKSRPEFRKLICHYSNLYYVCRDCNLYKGAAWPSSVLRAQEFRFLDPCTDDFSLHWIVRPDGILTPKTPAGAYMIARLRLNREYLREWRRHKTVMVASVDRLAGRKLHFKCELFQKVGAFKFRGACNAGADPRRHE